MTRPRTVPLAALAIFALGALLYAGTLHDPFVWDDVPSIVEARSIEALWPPARALSGPPGSGQSGRPLVALSLALNYAVGARGVLGYHLVNIALHALAGVALFGVVRRGCLAAGGGEAARATELAFAAAALWVAHPLHTDALNHVVYRNETMMALFYLVTLYCALRAFAGGRGWRVAAVAACVAAMASKEVAVSLPLAVLALDAFFGAGSARAALRERGAWYAALAATWLALALFVAGGDRGESVGVAHADVLSPLDYFRTQLVAVPLYLRLAVWPHPLIFDRFDGEVVRAWGPVLVPLVLLGALLALSLWALWKKRVAGLLGVAVAAILAPTSSVVPLGGELAAEHRMVLALAPLALMAVLLAHRLLSWIGPARRVVAPVLLVAAVGALGATTVARNRDYASAVTLWRDTVTKLPVNSRAWNQLGLACARAGLAADAEAAYREALRLEPREGSAPFNLGNLLLERGDLAGAAQAYALAARAMPDDPIVHNNLGEALLRAGDAAEGLAALERALALRPDWERPARRVAWQRATNPDARLRDGARALELARRLPGDTPRDLDVLAAALAESGDFAQARATATRARGRARARGGRRGAGRQARRARRAVRRGPTLPPAMSDASPSAPAEPRWSAWLAVLVLLAAGAAAYANSLHGVFVFDDTYTIETNPNLRSLLPLSSSLTGPGGTTVSGRPLPAFSLALNYAAGGLEPFGYHVVNVALHLAAALALFALLRTTLRDHLGARGRFAATGPAFLAALLWELHPLHTDALDHVSYRTETMMALFYLAALACAARAFAAPGRRWAAAGAVVCAFAAVASKEAAVSLPLVVLLFDRQFVSGSFGAALRARRGFYAALAASWLLLALLVVSGDRGESVGFDIEEISSLDYLRTQARGLWLYLRLAAWPRPLVLDYYGYEIVTRWRDVWLEGLGVLLLFGWTLAGVARRRAWSVPALAIFAVLAPSSSFIPLTGEVVAEHRMVLPLAGLAALVVLGAARRVPRAARLTPLALGAALVYGGLTHARNADYATLEGIWRDTVEKRPDNARALNTFFKPLMDAGKLGEAEDVLLRSLALRPKSVRALNNLGMLRSARQDWAGAEEALRRCLAARPEHAPAHLNLARLYAQRERWAEAEREFAEVARLTPLDSAAFEGRGQMLLRLDRPAEAAASFREALRLAPGTPGATRLLAWILATSRDPALRDGDQALRLAEALCKANPQPRFLEVLAAALAEVGRFDEAVRVSQDAARRAEARGEPDLARGILTRAQRYAQGKPFRE
ncbi:MAG: tetratricopeptide repeat protein [Planctomycetes bacterium]|nr:tetratricopeptide repeat protein [Planctomycetota bacterium]